MTRCTKSNPMRHLWCLSVAAAVLLAAASTARAHEPSAPIAVTASLAADVGRHEQSEKLTRIASALIPTADDLGYVFHFPFFYAAPRVVRHFYVSADLNGPWVAVQEFEASAAGQFTMQAFVPASLVKGRKDRMDCEFYLRDVPANGAPSTTILIRGFIGVPLNKE